MKHLVLVPLFLLAPPAMAQHEEPSWEVKRAALMRAYETNGNRMSGWGMLDATEPRVVKTDRIKPTTPLPVDKPVQKAEQPDLNMDDLREFSRKANYKTDICVRHGLHKVMVRGGKSWRCK